MMHENTSRTVRAGADGVEMTSQAAIPQPEYRPAERRTERRVPQRRGMRTDPAVSVPSPAGTMRAATAARQPPLELLGMRDRS
jgi:hypothetical protein